MTAGPTTSTWREEALRFTCDGDQLLGVLTRPLAGGDIGSSFFPADRNIGPAPIGQNVFLARAMANHRITTLRFEGRGMGDSEGSHPGFAALGPDIEAAISALHSAAPGIAQVILYGLCDAATAIALAPPTAAIDGAILLNPWARSEKTLAATQIRTHYPRRILSGEFWKKLLIGRINPWTKVQELLSTVAMSRQAASKDSLPDRLQTALATCERPVLLLLSGSDMTAAEFEGEVLPRLRQPLPAHLTIARIPGADHTFSRVIWWNDALDHIESWLAQRHRS